MIVWHIMQLYKYWCYYNATITVLRETKTKKKNSKNYLMAITVAFLCLFNVLLTFFIYFFFYQLYVHETRSGGTGSYYSADDNVYASGPKRHDPAAVRRYVCIRNTVVQYCTDAHVKHLFKFHTHGLRYTIYLST